MQYNSQSHSADTTRQQSENISETDEIFNEMFKLQDRTKGTCNDAVEWYLLHGIEHQYIGIQVPLGLSGPLVQNCTELTQAMRNSKSNVT